MALNKNVLIQKIIAQLQGEFELYLKAARAAHGEATDEQSKAENKYDTRALEASYLARGQARQAVEIQDAIQQFEFLALRSFGPDDPIEVSALVELAAQSERSFYFMAPRAGGTEITHDDHEVLVITPTSPLGRQLLGKRQGERLQIAMGGTRKDYQVVSVS